MSGSEGASGRLTKSREIDDGKSKDFENLMIKNTKCFRFN